MSTMPDDDKANSRPKPYWLWALAKRLERTRFRNWPMPLVPAHRTRIDGFDLELEPAGNFQDYILWRQRAPSEAGTIALLSRYVRQPGAVFFDIGANCGTFSLWLGREMTASGTLCAFEPNPHMAARLRRNLGRAGLEVTPHIHEVALGPANDVMTLRLGWPNRGTSSLRRDAKGKEIRVDVRTLSEFLPAEAPDGPFVVKADIEGFEDQLFIPFFNAVPKTRWPDVICIEISGARHWDMDLQKTLNEIGYKLVAEVDNNGIFKIGRRTT